MSKINGKIRIEGQLVQSIWGDRERPRFPGDFSYYQHPRSGDKILGILFVCPCGCQQVSRIPFEIPENRGSARWKWDGNVEKPTITPSIRRLDGCKFHGYLVSGVFAEC